MQETVCPLQWFKGVSCTPCNAIFVVSCTVFLAWCLFNSCDVIMWGFPRGFPNTKTGVSQDIDLSKQKINQIWCLISWNKLYTLSACKRNYLLQLWLQQINTFATFEGIKVYSIQFCTIFAVFVLCLAQLDRVPCKGFPLKKRPLGDVLDSVFPLQDVTKR